MSSPTLVVSLDDGEYSFAVPAGSVITVGRGAACDVVIAHAALARRQLTFDYQGERCKVTEVGGTQNWLDRQPIRPNAWLTIEGESTINLGPLAGRVSYKP